MRTPLSRSPRYRPHVTLIIAGSLLSLALIFSVAQSVPAEQAPSLDDYVRQFESSYHAVRTLRASFTQEYSAWNHTRVESGEMYLERGRKMRWEYRKPEEKLFLSD